MLFNSMPNWCRNSAKFIFPNLELYDKFNLAILDKCVFSTFVPLGLGRDPKGLEVWDFSLAIEKWGTKSDPSEWEIIEPPVSMDQEEITIQVEFDTAWAPPIGFYESIKKTHGIYTIAYFHESGEHVFGSCIYNEDIDKNRYYNYPLNATQLLSLRAVIGINGELDVFMFSEWNYLEEMWNDRDSGDEFDM
jgi:hypothetical protein